MLLSLGDVARIAAAVGADDFYEVRHYPDLSFLRQYDYDPNWARYTVLAGHRRRQLRVRADGSCVLLSPAGCVLPTAARPLMCRLYPHDYNESAVRGFCTGDDLACPVHLLRPGESLEQVIGESSAQIEQWRALLYRELREEYAARGAAD